jgi:hypothetical protein
MFDSVTLNQDIQLHIGGIAPQGTDGAIASNWECSALKLSAIADNPQTAGISDR